LQHRVILTNIGNCAQSFLSAFFSGEHRLIACPFRQSAEKPVVHSDLASLKNVVGKLPTTAGWQPALRRRN
jgi:hypothetical protein